MRKKIIVKFVIFGFVDGKLENELFFGIVFWGRKSFKFFFVGVIRGVLKNGWVVVVIFFGVWGGSEDNEWME